jgi:hypothetical protein
MLANDRAAESRYIESGLFRLYVQTLRMLALETYRSRMRKPCKNAILC